VPRCTSAILPKPVLRVNVVIARKHVTIVFDRQALAAELGGDAAALRRQTDGLRDRSLEQVDVHPAVVVRVPVVPDRAQERAPVVRVHRPVGHHRIGFARLGPAACPRSAGVPDPSAGYVATLWKTFGSTHEISCTRHAPRSRVRKR